MKKLYSLFLFFVPVLVFANTYSADFSGSSQYASITNDLSIQGTQSSYSVWAKPDDTGNYYYISQADGGTNVAFSLDFTGGTWRFNRERSFVANCAITYSDSGFGGTWVHMVGTYDGTNIRMYKNGSLVAGPATCTGSGSSGLSDGMFIASSYGPGGYLAGQLDDVIVFNTDIGATRASELYSDPCNPVLDNAVARYELDNDFVDSVGAFDLVGSGSPTFVSNTAYSCDTSGEVATSTGATTTEAILVNGFMSLIFGLSLILFLLMLFVSGYLYNNIIKPFDER